MNISNLIMAPHFTFRAYVLSVIDPKRICVRVDKEYIESVSNVLSAANDKTTVKDTIIVNVSDCRFAITNITWTDLSDLVGVNVEINATSRKYNFWKVKERTDSDNESRWTEVNYKGVSIHAKKISNIL